MIGTAAVARRTCDASAYPEPLVALARHRLPGTVASFPAEPLGGPEWVRAATAAQDHRITGLLHAAVADGALPATAEQARQAKAAHRTAQLRVLILEGELARIAALLGDAGIECRALKGSALARLDYADPTLRSFHDIDVLVRADDIDRAAEVLGEAGFARTLAEPRPGFDRRFDKGMTLRPATGYELDLHRTFVLGPWGVLVNLDRLWEGGDEFEAAGRTVRALSRPHRFLHACYHAALGDWPLRLGSLRDVAELLRRVDSGPDAAAVRRIAAEWGAEAVVAAAVADTVRLLGLDGDGELTRWAASYTPGRREQQWLALHTHEDKTFAAQALATLRVLPRWRDRVSYLHALVLPDRRYTAGRHASAWGRFAYAVKEIRKGRGAR